MNVSFSSTYRVPITQPGVNNAKKDKLRTLTQKYGGLISSSKTGAARVSLPNELDDKLVIVPIGKTFSIEEIEKLVHFSEQHHKSVIIK